jgi:hypothetical protein
VTSAALSGNWCTTAHCGTLDAAGRIVMRQSVKPQPASWDRTGISAR